MRRLLVLLTLLSLAPPALAAGAAEWPRVTVLERGMIFRQAHPRVLGLDGAYSLPLGGGRSRWIFGDTLLGSWMASGSRDITAMPPNTAAIVTDADVATGFAHARFEGEPPRPVLEAPRRPADRRHWPIEPVEEGVFFVEIEPFGTGALDFHVRGHGLARALANGQYRVEDLLWPGEAPAFGTSVLTWKGHRYLFAGGAQTHLARIPSGERLSREAGYRYWTGKDWSRDWRQAAALPGSGPEMSVRYNAYLGGFLMIYVPPFGKTVEARLATHPWGPWSAPRVLARCQPEADAEAMFYGAKQHVELDREGGRTIMISYNTNAPSSRLPDRPDLYWPRLLELRFER